MDTFRFVEHKVKRNILTLGNVYKVTELKLNQYGEPLIDETGEIVYEEVGEIKGLFHTSNSYVTESISEASRTYTKQQPMILCMMSDIGIINNKSVLTDSRNNKFNVIMPLDVSKAGIVIDMSLKEVSGNGNSKA